MDFTGALRRAIDNVLYYIRNTMSNDVKTRIGWTNVSTKVKDVFNIGSPYNGHKGTPNLIHPPDTSQDVPPLPPLLVSMQRDRLDAIKKVSNGGGYLNIINMIKERKK